MATIPLRVYLREIEGKIDREQFEEVIAHCRHILEVYPKHIDTYRVLGKAFLEAKRYTDAADILQRVLSSLPGDFIANLGMSIIREDEGNLDDAIWFMERAFEVQPANSAIQAEMQRLYGRRDGIEPPRIRLTRGALARMYVKGGLYPQAIAEIRAALTEDPERADLQALLAVVYHASGQRVEAAQVCSALLKKLPFCLEANRILADILKNTDRDQEAQIYLQRLYALDPYAAHTSPNAPASDMVPETSVMIDALDWQAEGIAVASRLAWAQTLGVDVQTENPSEDNIPDWMREAGWEQAPSEASEIAEINTVEGLEEDVAPAELEEADMPDWLKSMAPSQPLEGEGAKIFELDELELEAQPEEAEPGSAAAELPEWLTSIEQEAETDSLTGEGAKAFEMSDWLSDSVPSSEVEAEEAELEDWLQEFPPQEGEEAVFEGAQEPGGAAEDEAKAGETAVEAPEQELLAEEVESGVVEIDQLLEGVWEPEEAQNLEEALITEESEEAPVSLEDQEAAFAWLESLAARQGAEEALLLSPEERLENPPEWVQEAILDAEDQAGTGAEGEAEAAPHAEAETGRADTSASVGEEAEIPAWLAGLTVEDQEQEQPEKGTAHDEGAHESHPGVVAGLVGGALAFMGKKHEEPEEIESPPASVQGAVAAGILHIEEGSVVEEDTQPTRTGVVDETGATETQGPTPEGERVPATKPALPDETVTEAAGAITEAEVAREDQGLKEAWEPEEAQNLEEALITEESEEAPVSLEDQEAAFAWLESLAARQGAEEALLLSPEERLENPPEWVQEAILDAEDQAGIDTETDAFVPVVAAIGAIVEPPERTGEPTETVSPPPPPSEKAEDLEQEIEEAPALESEEAVPELPTWLASYEEEPEAEEEPGWIPPSQEMPRPLLDLNRAALNELERLPGIGFIRAQNILQYRQSHGDFASIDELKNVPGFDPESVAEVRDFFFVETAAAQPSQSATVETFETTSHPGITTRLSDLETVDPDQVTLIQARNALTQANRDEAMVHYTNLIQSERLLPEVIQDLHEVLYRFPVDVEIWQALGDAYVRSDQLRQAMDAYTKAEELLR